MSRMNSPNLHDFSPPPVELWGKPNLWSWIHLSRLCLYLSVCAEQSACVTLTNQPTNHKDVTPWKKHTEGSGKLCLRGHVVVSQREERSVCQHLVDEL